MPSLLEEIREINKDATRALESAGCSTDYDIKSLTRTDLNELLPGPQNFYVRKKVFEKIQKTKKPIDVTLKELKSFIPDEDFRAALTGSGAPADYLNTLKELKGHVTQFQIFIDAHINLLEGLHENQGQELIEQPCTSAQVGPEPVTTCHPQQTHEAGIPNKPLQTSNDVKTVTLVTVKNKTIVTGETLKAHLDVLRKVEKQFFQREDSFQIRLEEKETFENCDIIIVFCPVVSRAGTDVDSAMRQVPASVGKHVILVLMHHTREAKTSYSLRSWPRPEHVVLNINVFFHDTIGGLLNCTENDDAVSEIQRKLLDYGIHTKGSPISQKKFGSFRSIFDSFSNRLAN